MCPSITSTIEAKIEAHMKKKFEAVIGQNIERREWAQACLPTKSHGCGLGHPPDTISAAFAANVEETISAVKEKLPATTGYIDLVDAPSDIFDTHEFASEDIRNFVRTAREKKQTVIDAATTLMELPALTNYDADKKVKKKTQYVYADFINRARAKHFEDITMDHGSKEDRARFHSTNGNFAGAWLHNIPKDAHNTMSSSEFRVALKLRLGSPFYTQHPLCCCQDRTRVDTSPTHFFSCNEMKPFLLIRHDIIQTQFMKLAHHGKVAVSSGGLGGLVEEDGRKGDLLFPDLGHNYSSLVVDFCIANACAFCYLNNACETEGHALLQLEKIKIVKYQEAYRRVGVHFKPIAAEMHGVISKTFQWLLQKLVSKAAARSRIPYGILLSYWQKRISTALQKANAKVLHLAELKVAREFGFSADIIGGEERLFNDCVLNDNHNFNPV